MQSSQWDGSPAAIRALHCAAGHAAGRGLGSGLCAGHPCVCPCRDWCTVSLPPLVPCLQDSQQGGSVQPRAQVLGVEVTVIGKAGRECSQNSLEVFMHPW